jgi:MinD-like ATPase involved in chromosome partitioning or flagellar assembly
MTTTPPTRIGKTTVAACVGSIFAQLRHDDRVVANADTAFGKLGARVDPHAAGGCLWI